MCTTTTPAPPTINSTDTEFRCGSKIDNKLFLHAGDVLKVVDGEEQRRSRVAGGGKLDLLRLGSRVHYPLPPVERKMYLAHAFLVQTRAYCFSTASSQEKITTRKTDIAPTFSSKVTAPIMQ